MIDTIKKLRKEAYKVIEGIEADADAVKQSHRVIKLVDALEFYADKNMYDRNQMQFSTGEMLSKVECEMGEVARKAIREAGEVC